MKKFAIFGNPVKHSKSPNMHNAGFSHLNLNAIYEKHLLSDGEKIAEVFLQNGYMGANITAPFKQIAFEKAHEVKGIAKQIKAVNTYINQNGKIIAYNTDAQGFLNSIKEFDDIKNVLLLGSGGTAKAIALALRQDKKDITILNRSEERLDFFKALNFKCFTHENFKIKNYELVINSTSAGLKDEHLPFDEKKLEQILKNCKYAFDCIYDKLTPFLKLAKKCDCQCKDGKDMLLHQGILAFELFTKIKANRTLVQIMKESL